MTFLATGFQHTDGDTSGTLISCLEAITHHPFFQEIKNESFHLLHVSGGIRVLEIGCGTGADAWHLAQVAGEEGVVAAIDTGIGMLKVASSRLSNPEDHALPFCSPSFIRMDGRLLAFPDASFDVAREDRVLQHISNPDTVIAEMLRVLKPGGIFTLFEPDWELFIIDGSDRSITRKIMNFWADQFQNGWIGRALYRICKEQGATDLSLRPRTLVMYDLKVANQIFAIQENAFRAADSGVITRDEAAVWYNSLTDAACSNTFFCSFTGYLVSGKKES